MSEMTVNILAAKLNISEEQANVLWLKARQAILETLLQGSNVDLGIGCLQGRQLQSRRRFDFTTQMTITTPPRRSLKIITPPHVKALLSGDVAAVSPFLWMTRSQLKNLSAIDKAELAASGLDYYALKGVTV